MASTSESSDGPVLTVLSKRIRNLRKKLNRITQIEQSQNPIKNKEQQDLLLSKPSLVAVIDELEKLRLPLTAAVDEELKNTVSEKPKKGPPWTDRGADFPDFIDSDSSKKSKNGLGGDDVSKEVGGDGDDVISGKIGEVVEDLLKVIYFGSVFNVKMRSEFDNIMLTRTHERNCCLAYDTVTDDDVAVFLNEGDLDSLTEMSELLVSRPADSSFSHEDALRRCVGHARNWIAGSEERIDENSNVTCMVI
ncbi:hypothetical protein Tco_0984143 [Tanacetum coccineum]